MAISIRAVGSWAASNATTQTVTLPTHATGDMLIVRTIRKPFTSPDNTVINTSGWLPVATGVANGATANGNGTGSMGFKAFYKIATSAAEANPVVTWGTTAAPGAAVALSYQCGAGESFIVPVGNGGGDATARTSQTSTIASHVSVVSGDMVDFFRGQCDDSGALTVPTITQTGVTFNAVTEAPAAALLDGTSNDIAADGGYRLATAGTSSAAAVVTGTSAASEEHGAWMTRLRVVATQDYAPAIITQTAATFDPTITVGVATISVALLNQAAVSHAPTVTSVATISVGLISQTAATFDPTVEAINPIIWGPWSEVFTNEITAGNQDVPLDLIDQTAVAHAPTVTSVVTISLALINQTAVALAPTITTANTISVALTDQTAVAFAPTVTAGVVDVSVARIDQTALTFAPTVTTANAISVAIIDQTATPHAPTVSASNTISVAVIDQTAVAFDPTVTTGVATVSVGIIDQTAVTFSPTVTTVAYVDVALIDRTAQTFDPTVTTANAITVARIDQPAATFSPTVTTGVVDVSLALIDRTATAHAPTVANVSVVDLARIDQTAQTFAPTVDTFSYVLLPLLSAPASAFEPMVQVEGVQAISLALLSQLAVAFDIRVQRRRRGGGSGAAVVLQGFPAEAELQLVGFETIASRARAFAPEVSASDDESLFGIADDNLLGLT